MHLVILDNSRLVPESTNSPTPLQLALVTVGSLPGFMVSYVGSNVNATLLLLAKNILESSCNY
jgi:hypothetical protein